MTDEPVAGDQPEPAAAPEQQADPVDAATADTIRRQDSDAEGWYRSLPYRPRP